MTIHFLYSLMYLVLVVGLMYLYVVIPYVAFLILRYWRRQTKNRSDTIPPLCGQQQRKTLAILAVVVLLMVSTTYLGHRALWMGKGNGNLVAKEYFIVGQTVNSYKAILTTLLHPELHVIRPMTNLQWVLYKKGVAQISGDDGEPGVWQNMWFHHHFGKKDRKYFGVKGYKPSTKMIKVLDQYWFSLESMATKPFADKEMEEKYLEGFAGLAFSYMLEDGFYSGKRLGSYRKMAKLPEQVKRTKLLLRWLNDLRTRWKNSPTLTRTIHNNPKVLVVAQLALLTKLEDMILAEIHSRKFNCDQPSIHQYVQLRKEFYSPDNGKPAYKKIRNRHERAAIYHIAINSAGARDTKYLVEHYCGYKMAGKMDMSSAAAFAKDKNITPEEQEELECRASLREEVKIIEEQSDAR